MSSLTSVKTHIHSLCIISLIAVFAIAAHTAAQPSTPTPRDTFTQTLETQANRPSKQIVRVRIPNFQERAGLPVRSGQNRFFHVLRV